MRGGIYGKPSHKGKSGATGGLKTVKKIAANGSRSGKGSKK